MIDALRANRLLTALAALGFAVLCGLGSWQLQRLNEKNAFLATLAAEAERAPASLPADANWTRLDLDSLDLRRVALAGEWLPGTQATVRVVMPETLAGGLRGGFGRYAIQALRLDAGGIVLVNRGFVAESEIRRLSEASGRAALTGILRKPEAGNAFTPRGDAGQRDFHLRDPAPIAAALGLQAAPFMVEAERAPGAAAYPLGVDVRELIGRVPNNHLQYAFTWFGLAATLIGVLLAYLRSRSREAGEGPSS